MRYHASGLGLLGNWNVTARKDVLRNYVVESLSDFVEKVFGEEAHTGASVTCPPTFGHIVSDILISTRDIGNAIFCFFFCFVQTQDGQAVE